jgi:hypothetical protein
MSAERWRTSWPCRPIDHRRNVECNHEQLPDGDPLKVAVTQEFLWARPWGFKSLRPYYRPSPSPRWGCGRRPRNRNAGLNALPCFGVEQDRQPVVLANAKEFSNDVVCKSVLACGGNGRWRLLRLVGACPNRDCSACPAQPRSGRCRAG